DSLIARLKVLVRKEDAAEEAAAVDVGPEPEEPVAVTGNAIVVRVRLVDDALMPAVRAYHVLSALADHGRIARSQPAEADVESFAGREIVAWIETDHEADSLAQTAKAVADVADATAEEHHAEEEHVEKQATVAKKHASSTVRVDSERLDALMHVMGEVVVHRTHVESLVADVGDDALTHAVQDLARSSQALQAMVMQVLMIPVDAVMLRFPRLVRDLSGKLDKKVELVLSGRETELDRTVVDALGDPLVHLVRNALDHGIESPEDRVKAGK